MFSGKRVKTPSLKISNTINLKCNVKMKTKEEVHNRLREILIKYNCPEYGDCIVDEISSLFEFPTTVEALGEFVNDGSDYQVFDYLFSPFNTDEGFTNIEVRDFDENVVYEIAGLEMIDEDSEIEDILNFEDVVKSILQGEGLL